MASLIEELQRREAAARREVDELRGEIARLNERLAGAEERLSRLEITRETVAEILGGAGTDEAAAGGKRSRRQHRQGQDRGLRSKLKRLAERGWLAEDGPGLFTLPAAARKMRHTRPPEGPGSSSLGSRVRTRRSFSRFGEAWFHVCL